MTRRTLATGGLVVLVAAGAAGCESTQTRSARLAAAAKDRKPERGLRIGSASKTVRPGRATVLTDANGTVLVVELRNRSRRSLARVPISVDVTDRARKSVYRNDTPGLEPSLTAAALLPRRRSTLWVNDQITPSGKAVRALVVAGAGGKRVRVRIPRIVVASPRLVRDPTSGVSAVGRVSNRSRIDQRDLVVSIAARRGDRFVAAGRAVVRRLRAGGSARFTAFLIGDARGARLQAVAPPTTLR